MTAAGRNGRSISISVMASPIAAWNSCHPSRCVGEATVIGVIIGNIRLERRVDTARIGERLDIILAGADIHLHPGSSARSAGVLTGSASCRSAITSFRTVDLPDRD